MNTQISAAEARRAFDALGYKLSIKSNPLNRSIGNFQVTGHGLKKLVVGGANVHPRSLYCEHSTMFALANSYRQKTVGSVKIY